MLEYRTKGHMIISKYAGKYFRKFNATNLKKKKKKLPGNRNQRELLQFDKRNFQNLLNGKRLKTSHQHQEQDNIHCQHFIEHSTGKCS
jgi:hypothetical protein